MQCFARDQNKTKTKLLGKSKNNENFNYKMIKSERAKSEISPSIKKTRGSSPGAGQVARVSHETTSFWGLKT